jgi:hypothetical protein
MGINGIVDFLCDNRGVVSFTKENGVPRIEVVVTFIAYDRNEMSIKSVGSTLEAAMERVPKTVERRKKRPNWKRS